ncbi:TIGR01244 family sulfur transferase [Ruegeria arenilitoris]|uniref:TIGR01244 family sulfur transferase n=1 Tax=Ruegeria arenilitoris TaxID=1173585 RepID=UPI00147EE945|nr:TIGR01244 family sulfur transferase [Ruegeria arenilitoris]
MDIKKLSGQFATCGQVVPGDMDEIKKLGFKSLVCARPDGEAEGQPPFAEIDKSARAQGLSMQYIPVSPSGPTDYNHVAFAAALAELPGPVLGYCRSGQRAAKLWQAHQNALG